jgi:hypothetical protein
MSSSWQPQVPAQALRAAPDHDGPEALDGAEQEQKQSVEPKKKVVVVGLGMVGISFM